MIHSGLIIFQKNAILGTVKTRLAATVGDERAFEIYNWLTSHTHQVAKGTKVDKFIFYSDFIPDQAIQEYPGYHFEIQRGADLGARMQHAFSVLFAGGYSNVVIIGTDCPDLKVSDLTSAFLILGQNDLVLGPARDGGYYLLGMRKFFPELFREIPWSTPRVLEMTLDIADHSKLDYEFLKIHSDVDTFDDWQEFISRSQSKEL